MSIGWFLLFTHSRKCFKRGEISSVQFDFSIVKKLEYNRKDERASIPNLEKSSSITFGAFNYTSKQEVTFIPSFSFSSSHKPRKFVDA